MLTAQTQNSIKTREVIVKIVLRVAHSDILRTSFNFPMKATSVKITRLVRAHVPSDADARHHEDVRAQPRSWQ